MSRRSADWRSIWSFVKPKSVLQWILGPLILLAVLGWFVGIPIVANGVSPSATWDGGSLLLTSARQAGGECVIAPQDGAEKRVDVHETSGNSTQTLAEEVEPWFSGSAEVTCNDEINIHTGWEATVKGVSLSFGGLMGFAVGAGILCLIYLFAGSGGSSQSGDATRRRTK